MVMMREPVHRVFLKTQFCKFFQQGKCTRAGACKFAHTQEELQPVPDFKLTKMCPAMRRTGFCEKGDACTFAHNAEELRMRVRTPACPRAPAAGAPPPPQRCAASPPARAARAEAALVPPPQPAEAPRILMLVQGLPSQMQTVQVVPVVSMQGMPAPAPVLCSSVDLGAANCTQVFGSTTPSGSKKAAGSPDSSSLADPFDASCCQPMDDDDLELDLPGNSWSRQSTEEGAAEPMVDFDCQSSAEEDWEYIQDSEEAAGSEAFEAPPARFEMVEAALKPGVAAALGHRYVVKKTFIEFDEEDMPCYGIRRVNSTGANLSLAL